MTVTQITTPDSCWHFSLVNIWFDPQNIATKGFLLVFSTIWYDGQHTKNLIKSNLWNGVFEGVALYKLINIHEIYLDSHIFCLFHF